MPPKRKQSAGAAEKCRNSKNERRLAKLAPHDGSAAERQQAAALARGGGRGGRGAGGGGARVGAGRVGDAPLGRMRDGATPAPACPLPTSFITIQKYQTALGSQSTSFLDSKKSSKAHPDRNRCSTSGRSNTSTSYQRIIKVKDLERVDELLAQFKNIRLVNDQESEAVEVVEAVDLDLDLDSTVVNGNCNNLRCSLSETPATKVESERSTSNSQKKQEKTHSPSEIQRFNKHEIKTLVKYANKVQCYSDLESLFERNPSKSSIDRDAAQPITTEDMTERIDKDTLVVDVNNIPVAYYFSAIIGEDLGIFKEMYEAAGVRENFVDFIYQAICSLWTLVPETARVGSKESRYNDFDEMMEAFKKEYPKGRLGDIHFCFWAATGRHTMKEAVSSSEIGMKDNFSKSKGRRVKRENNSPIVEGMKVEGHDGSATIADGFVKLMSRMGPLLDAISEIFRIIEPETWKLYNEAFKDEFRQTIYGMAMPKNMVFLGLVLVQNICVRPHKDKSDFREGFTAMFCVGRFRGGDLVLSDCKVGGTLVEGGAIEGTKVLRFRYQPGDLIFIRAAILEHYVMPFDGLRIGGVLFSHKSAFGNYEYHSDTDENYESSEDEVEFD